MRRYQFQNDIDRGAIGIGRSTAIATQSLNSAELKRREPRDRLDADDPQLLLARAQDSGDRVFCKFKGQQTTFRSLLAKVQEMAGALQEAGVKRGDRVGFMLTTSVEHIALYLATSWIGAAAVPFSVHLKSAGIEPPGFECKAIRFCGQSRSNGCGTCGFRNGPQSPRPDLVRGWR